MKTIIKNAYIYSSDTSSFQKGSVLFDEKIIGFDCLDNSADFIIDANEALLIPGFVDVHTHGRAGYDFCDATEDQMKEMAKSYASKGTTSLFPTLASAPYDELMRASDKINSLKGKTGGAEFLGIHLEGRYLNPLKKGAHAPELLCPPNAEEIEELVFRMQLPCHITAALELDTDESFTKKAKSLGATLGLGHTNADYATAYSLYQKYGISFSHLFNTMPPLSHRDSGPVCAGLTTGAYCELICDGIHIAPEMINLSYRCLGNKRLSLITDSMQAAGCKDGSYSIAGNPCVVKNGKALTPEGNLAGSTLDMKTAVENLMAYCNIPLEQALRSATLTPAEQVGVDRIVGSISVGKRSDMLLVNLKENTINIEKVFVNGNLI